MVNRLRKKLENLINSQDMRYRDEAWQAIHQVLEYDLETYTNLVAALRNPSVPLEIRETLCWILARLGNKGATPALVIALKDENPDLRKNAAIALGHLGSRSAVKDLKSRLIKDEDAGVRLCVANALGEIRDTSTINLLINRLMDTSENAQVRGQVAEALGNLGDKRAIDPLITMLEDASDEVRFWSVYALGQLGSEQALPKLREIAATDTSTLPNWGKIREEALESIRTIEKNMSNK